MYQDKTRQYRAAQKQREENEMAKKKDEQRLKVSLPYFVMLRFTVKN